MTSSNRPDDRLRFARNFGFRNDLTALPADASARQYFRLSTSDFGPCMLMDVPPTTPGFSEYIQIAEYLRDNHFSAPKVYATDAKKGFALIEDFGDTTYTNLLKRGHDETELYELAIDVLATFHDMPCPLHLEVPNYDETRLLTEAMLLPEWFAPTLPHAQALPEFHNAYQALWHTALRTISERRDTLVFRDFHIDNLMLLDARDGHSKCGLLDFQDAMIGGAAYDVMSLLQDARRDVPPALETKMIERYLAQRPNIDAEQFMLDYHLYAAQRHSKIAGIFHRLNKRDGKSVYLHHMPRVLRQLQNSLKHANLNDISELLEHHLGDWARAAD
ncbi:aminoglycoside phosphotransferase family protein [Cochlodiniinecator piscidefendens]|uniref:aminoglycoside phosphotransferase family protein n=1 Tax=Cochlodiniinecator piscidefendens TaxID=2715756 RepID=UPI00140B5474